MAKIITIRILQALTLLLLAAGVCRAGEVSAFVYHRFGDARYPSTNISIQTFSDQLAWLKANDYRVLPLGDIVRRLRAGQPLPERCVVLTVDDAFRTFLTGAMPLLRHYGYPVTLFVSTDSVGGEDYLSWEDLRKLAREGVEIGSHTASHAYLVDRRKGETKKAWLSRVRGDILKAQEVLKKELGKAPALFAYPYGEYSPEIVEEVRDLGFAGAVGQQSGVIYQGSDLFLLPRFPMGGPYGTLRGFKEKAAMRALSLRVLSPESPIVNSKDNPPALVVKIDCPGADLSRLRCFVSGRAESAIKADPEVPGKFLVQATQPLTGRRSKYTLTAPALHGRSWYWFSQLWIRPK
jgi:peptidoglycan/xylan/chitin deacetylase (PgdA/CDA1 family)